MADNKITALFIISIFMLSAGLYPAQAQQSPEQMVVGTVGDEPVRYGELTKNYKSSTTEPYSFADLKDFLPVYLDYRAKIVSAKENGYFENEELLAEYRQYAKQAAYSFWLEKEIRPEVFAEYYERAQTEFKVFHVLIQAPDNASEEELRAIEDSLAAAAEEIRAGKDLETINRKYSSVSRGRSMGGILPWFSAGKTVKPFEDAAYSLRKGEISEPVKTQFGYHILTLLDKRPKTPARLVRHIYVRQSRDSSAFKKISEAHAELENGAPWAEVLAAYSQDEQSKRNGGRIGWMGYDGRFPEALVQTVMEVDPEAPYSAPEQSSYGYHIFSVDSVRTYESEAAEKEALMKEMEQSNLFRRNNSFVVAYLRNNMGTDVNTGALSSFEDDLSHQDSTLIEEIRISEKLAGAKLFAFRDQTYTVADYLQYLKNTRGSRTASEYDVRLINDYYEYVIDNQIIKLTLTEFPIFEEQTDSYLNGLVVYQINDDSVWSAATVDTSALRSIYQNNTSDYAFPERPFYYQVSARADSTLDKVKSFIRSGNNPDSLRTEIKGISVITDSTNTFQNEPYDRLTNMEKGEFSEYFDYKKRRSVFYLADRLPARPMTFKESFNRLMARYQPVREENWLMMLRSKYDVNADFEQLKKAFEKESGSL